MLNSTTKLIHDMTPEITNYECNKRNLNDGSEGAETMNKSNLFQVLMGQMNTYMS